MPIVLAEPSGEFLRIAAEQAAVYKQYAALAAAVPLGSESGLGGKLLFAGDLTQNSDLLRAANLAGAASLAASDDAAAQRAAMRDGVADFLVTTLEEALRILKNEIRKRQPVSVSVGVAPHVLIEQMLARGVLPDLLAPPLGDSVSDRDNEFWLRFREQGSAVVSPISPAGESYVAWSVHPAGARWLAQMEGCARDAMTAGEAARDRWLRMAPRYLGRAAQRQRGVMLDSQQAEEFRRRVEAVAAESASDTGEAVTVMLG